MATQARRGLTFLLLSFVLSAHAHAAATPDFRMVGHRDLLPDMDVFTDDGSGGVGGVGGNYSELLFDPSRQQVLVGARDAVYRLSLAGLVLLEKAVWQADEEKAALCQAKGQDEHSCRNYVRVLASPGGEGGGSDRVLVCGTHAFSPRCSWRESERVGRVLDWLDGTAKCPHSPADNVTSLMTAGGDYYVGASADFSGNDDAIYRMSGGKKLDDRVRTMQYNSLWLDRPSFVASFETEDHVYFLFRETAVEHTNCGKAVFSRIARVCKGDGGGSLVLKNTFTTFLKARLNCSLPGEYPFYYDEIQSAQFVPEEGLVYAAFTTGDNSVRSSAVCSFNLTSVESAFSGPFKTREDPDSIWRPKDADHSHFRCAGGSEDHLQINSKDYQLMDSAVQPSRGEPVYREDLRTFTHLAVDLVASKRSSVRVVFLATSDGSVLKLSHSSDGPACLVESLSPFGVGARLARMAAHGSSLYLTSESAVTRLDVHRCGRFLSRRVCLAAADPYCGWDSRRGQCATAPNKNPGAASWEQGELTCPDLSAKVDGGWGAWSVWSRCSLGEEEDPSSGSASPGRKGPGHCLCRERRCDNPPPSNGGAGCPGGNDGGSSPSPSSSSSSSLRQVANCTLHGGWTAWSEWGACSSTCDAGVRRRRRSCGNPAPAFGGDRCVGRDTDEDVCADLPECPEDGSSSSSSSSSALSLGQWGSWGKWSGCSTDCGKGFRTRDRSCQEGKLCGGCGRDFEECRETSGCGDESDVTDWTPWVRTGNSSSSSAAAAAGGWYEKRFRFTYRAPVALEGSGRPMEEERYCSSAGRCSVTSINQLHHDEHDDGGEDRGAWTEWSKCSRECGTGYQLRARECARDHYGECREGGMTVSERTCNTQACRGEWGCWSDWSGCQRGGGGVRRRSRQCRSLAGVVPGVTGASCRGGLSFEEAPCGEARWGEWGRCDAASGRQTRVSLSGAERQSRNCDPSAEKVDSGGGSGGVVAACVCCFLLGGLVGAGAAYYLLVRRRHCGAGGGGGGGGGGGPHYVSAKSQNLYVSLPMLDLKHRLHGFSSNQSDCSTLRSTTTAGGGTLRSNKGGPSSAAAAAAAAASSSVYGGAKSPTPVVDYETATIKRSHSQRNSTLLAGERVGASSMRADLDSDQLFT